jgi:hypothetical protein
VFISLELHVLLDSIYPRSSIHSFIRPSVQPTGTGFVYQTEYHNDGPNTGTYMITAQYSYDSTYSTSATTVINFGEHISVKATFPGMQGRRRRRRRRVKGGGARL